MLAVVVPVGDEGEDCEVRMVFIDLLLEEEVVVVEDAKLFFAPEEAGMLAVEDRDVLFGAVKIELELPPLDILEDIGFPLPEPSKEDWTFGLKLPLLLLMPMLILLLVLMMLPLLLLLLLLL